MPGQSRAQKDPAARHLPVRSPDRVEAWARRLESKLADPVALVDACKQLRQQLDRERLKSMDTSRLLQALMRAMKAHTQERILQSNVTSSINLLCTHQESNQDLFVREGGVDVLLTVMNQHQNFLILQEIGCEIAFRLGSGVLTLPQTTIEGVAQAVLTAMDAHMNEIQLVLHSMDTLARLKSKFNETLLRKSIATTVKSMRAHAQEPEVQSRGIDRLMDYADGKANIACLWAEDGLSAILAAMDATLRCKWFKESDPVQSVTAHGQVPFAAHLMEKCILFTVDMYMHDDAREEPGLTVLSRVIITYMQLPTVVYAALGTMTLASRKSKKNREILGRQAIRAVFLVLKKWMDNRMMLLNALRALYEVSLENSSNSDIVVEEECLCTLLKIMDMYVEESSVREHVCKLLSFVRTQANNKQSSIEAMDKVGCISCIIRALNQPVRDPDGQHAVVYACHLLHGLICHKVDEHLQGTSDKAAFQQSMAQQGAIDALISVVNACRNIDHHQMLFQSCFVLVVLLNSSPENTREYGMRVLQGVITSLLTCQAASSSACPADDYLARAHVFGFTLLFLIFRQAHTADDVALYQSEYASCGGIKALAWCLRMCDDDRNTQVLHEIQDQRPGSPRLPDAALITLYCTLSSHNDTLDMYAREDPMMMATILSLMVKHQADDSTRLVVHSLLLSVAAKHQHHARVFVSHGGTDIVTCICHKYEKEESFKFHALQTLEKITHMAGGGAYEAPPALQMLEIMQQMSGGCAYDAPPADCSQSESSTFNARALQTLEMITQMAGIGAYEAQPVLQALERISQMAGSGAYDARQRRQGCLSEKHGTTGAYDTLPASCSESDSTAHAAHGSAAAENPTFSSGESVPVCQSHSGDRIPTKTRRECDVCVSCGKTAADIGAKKLLKCSGCTIAPRYCSAACQKAGWKAHMAACKANRKAPK
jgi:hypothetical protein